MSNRDTMNVAAKRSPELSIARGWTILFWLPPALLVPCFLWFFWRVRLPFWDQVTMSLIFEKYYSAQLTLQDLWEPYNGHRIILHRLISLGLGILTRWSIPVEAVIPNLFNFATFLLVFREMKLFAARSGAALSGALLLFVSVMFFSLNQYENWFNGFDLGLVLSQLCTVGAFLVLCRQTLELRDVALAALLAIVSSFTFGAGVMTWPVGALAILLQPAKRKPLLFAIWSTLALITGATFITGAPAEARPAIDDMLRVPNYLASYLGAPVFSINGEKAVSLGATLQTLLSLVAPVVGLIGVLAALFGYVAARRRGFSARALNFPLMLCLFAILTGALIAVARARSGQAQAMSPHYISISRFLWIGAAMFWLVVRPAITSRIPHVFVQITAGAIGLMLFVSYLNGARHLRAWHRVQLRVQEQLWTEYDDVTLRMACPVLSFEELHRAFEALKRHRLALYHGANIGDGAGLYRPGNSVSNGDLPAEREGPR